jgi:hypothetical protein
VPVGLERTDKEENSEKYERRRLEKERREV